MGLFPDLGPGLKVIEKAAGELSGILREQTAVQRELVAELGRIRQILEPHAQAGGASFRGGQRQSGAPTEDLSWIGQTDEIAGAIREEFSRFLGRPLNDFDEAEIAERRARIGNAGGGAGGAIDGFSASPGPAEAETADPGRGGNAGGDDRQ